MSNGSMDKQLETCRVSERQSFGKTNAKTEVLCLFLYNSVLLRSIYGNISTSKASLRIKSAFVVSM